MLAAATLIWTVIAAVTGGFAVRVAGLSVASRDPWRPFLVAVVLGAVALLALGRERFFAWVKPIVGTRTQRPFHVAVIAAVGAFAMAAAWNTRAAGGSDSSCYVLQAEAFAHGRASLAPVLSETPPGVTPAALAPIGFIASPGPPHAAVPICASGLALMMAPLLVAGRDLVFLVVPVCAALLVWWTFAFGRRVADPGTAACAAVLLACSPIFLYQAVQPMSDIPAAALFMGALVFALRSGRVDTLGAGLLAGLAVLTRPNLAIVIAPLVLVLGNGDSPRFPRFQLSQKNGDRSDSPESRANKGFPKNGDSPRFPSGGKRGLSPFWWFCAGAAPVGLVMLALNAARYGGPLASGYGDSTVLFAWTRVAANMSRYPRWLIETQSPLIVLAVAGPVLLWVRGQWRLALAATLSVAAVFATYFAYTVFNDWWYIRFLLPALPLLIVFMTMTLFAMATRMSPAHGRAGAMLACALLASWYMDVAHRRHAMDLRTLEARFRVTGEYARRALPANAIALAVQHSGSLRFYGDTPTLAWDGIEPAALDGLVTWLGARGLAPFIVVEDAEEPRFRERFATQRLGQLDWPPSTEIHGAVRVRIYDPSERVSYEKGQRVETEHIR